MDLNKKAFYVNWQQVNTNCVGGSLKIMGAVNIQSPRLQRLASRLPVGQEIVWKHFTYKWNGEMLAIRGTIKCRKGACSSDCWGITEKSPASCFTHCDAMRATQSLFTYLAKEEDASSVSSSDDEDTNDITINEAKKQEVSQFLDSEDEGLNEIVNLENDQITQTLNEGEDSSVSKSGESLTASTQEENRISDSGEIANEISNGSGEAEGGSGESKTPTTVSEKTISEEQKTPLDSECQSKASRANKDVGDPASDESEGSSLYGLNSPYSEPGKKSGKEESCSEKLAGQDSSSLSEESGSLWELQSEPAEDQHAYGGGGGQTRALSAKDSDGRTEKWIILLLRQFLSSIQDIFTREEGREHWDARKVVCSAAYKPYDLPAAKFSRPNSRKMSLWVDVSGSVAYLSEFIISIITAACKDKDAQVVVGSEAHPEYVIPKEFLRSGKRWSEYYHFTGENYIVEFDVQVVNFLKKEQLEPGATIVVWSDYMDIHVLNLSRLARALKPYKVVWLCSHSGKDAGYDGNESFKLERFARKEGHLFLWGIDSPEGIRRALKYLNVRRRI